ncbi:MAG: four helix bundle protein [Clostridia bacterium]|nr:four helix bundle protein [Clostridia bacterium]
MDNIIEQKSFGFGIRIVKLYRYLCDTKKEFVLSKQLLRSGRSLKKILTSILKTSKKIFHF